MKAARMRSASIASDHRSQTFVRRLAIAASFAFFVTAHNAQAACQSDDDCKWPRMCSAGACTDPTAAPLPPNSCSRDKDCPGDTVCNGQQCVPAKSPPPTNLEISPLRPAEPEPQGSTPSTPPAPSTPPPAVSQAPIYVPPGLQDTPPQPPPPSLLQPSPPPKADVTKSHKPSKPTVFVVDLFIGAAWVNTQASTYTSSGLGGAIDGQALVGIQDNIQLGLRASASIMPVTSLYSAGPQIFMPDWHWGVTAAAANEGIKGGGREWGGQLELNFEYPLWSFLKAGGVAGAGLFKDAFEYTIRLEVGF